MVARRRKQAEERGWRRAIPCLLRRFEAEIRQRRGLLAGSAEGDGLEVVGPGVEGSMHARPANIAMCQRIARRRL